MKKSFFIIMIIYLLIYFAACSAANNEQVEKLSISRNINNKYGELSQEIDFDTILALDDARVYGYKLTMDGKCQFLEYNLRTLEKTLLGEADKFFISTDCVCKIDKSLFIEISSATSNNKEYNAQIYNINMAEKTVKIVSSEILDSPFVYIKPMEDNLLIFKQDVKQNTLTTFIDSFNPQSNENTKVINMNTSMDKRIGEQILNFDYDAINNRIYTLVQSNQNGNSRLLLEVYTTTGVLEYTIDVSSSLNNITGQAIIKLDASGKYLYVQNFSGTATIALIKDKDLYPLIEGDYEFLLEKASKYQTINNKWQIYYQQNERFLLLLDGETNVSYYVDITTDAIYSHIVYLYSDGNDILVALA